jgi:RNA methyltransferase, TrmH family
MKNEIPKRFSRELNKLTTRQGRRKSEYFLCEGKRCCSEALEACIDEVEALLYTEATAVIYKDMGCKTFELSDKDFLIYAQTENPQGVMLLMKKPVASSVKLCDDYLLVLDGLSEPGNVGTILRTAQAVGLTEVVLTRGSVDPYNAKAIRAGMGAQFKMNICMVEDLASLASLVPDKKMWLTSPLAETDLYSENFTLKDSILVFGEEGDGIKDFSVGERVKIPMPGAAESLNVAQAATLFLFEGVRESLLRD